MVERVARALFIRDWEPQFAYEARHDPADRWPDRADSDYYRNLARTAIEAMRTPTTAMLDAGEYTSPNIVSPSFARELFTAMIDAALRGDGAS